MKNALLLTVTLFLLVNSFKAQNLLWSKGFGNSMGEGITSVVVDGAGNVFTTGYFWNTVDFDPGPGTYTLTSNGNTDIFVQKLDANGNFLWAGHMGGVADDNGNSIALDASGNVYITGMFAATGDFDPSSSSTYSLIAPGGSYEAFVLKLSNTGSFVWAKRMGGTGTDEGFGVFIDGASNVYTTGKYQGTGDFDPGSGTTNLTSAGGTDVFIQKLNSSGTFVWAKSVGGAAADEGNKITVDASGNVHVIGTYQALADFDPGLTTANLTSSGLDDVFILKLDASGNYSWARSIGGSAIDMGNSIDLDPSGNVYTTGAFSGLADMDPGIGTANLVSNGLDDIFIHKLDASGNYVWAKQIGGSSSDIGSSVFADAANVYVTGNFSGTVDFDPNAGTANFNSSSGGAFVLKLNAAGNYQWAVNYGGIDAVSHTLDGSGNIFVTGIFGGTVDMDPGPGVSNLTSTGTSDNYVLKLNPLALSLKDQTLAPGIRIYPNPLTDHVQLKFDVPVREAEIGIFDLAGKKIFSSMHTDLIETKVWFDAAPGIYFMSIISPEINETFRIIKQ
jgi:hypothetical protein